MATQRHVRFDPRKVNLGLDPGECQRDLVLGSVADSTQPQYESRLNTIARFLQTWRGEETCEVSTITQPEFMVFLKSWKEQGMGDPEGMRDALLQLQRALGLETWAASKTVIKAVKGATGMKGPDKLVLDSAMIDQYEDFMINAKVELLGGCRKCALHLDTEYGRDLLVWANRMMQEIGIRLLNLLDMKTYHLDRKKMQLFVPRLKQAGGGPGHLPCPSEGAMVFDEVVKLVAGRYKDYLFPRCIQKHLNASLKGAGAAFQWEPGLVHTGYCLRHTGMSEKKKRVSLEIETVAQERGVTFSTAQHYCRPNEKRRKLFE